MKTIQFSMMLLLVILISVFGYFFASGMPYPKTKLEALEGTLYKGYYVYGFESSTFLPCDSEESWWVISNLPLIAEESLDGYKIKPDTLYFTEVGGEITAPGMYGHMGGSDRELKVTIVKSAEQARIKKCQANEFWLGTYLNKRL